MIAPQAPQAKSKLLVRASSDPVFVCIFGVTKQGKTTDGIYSFPRACFIADKGALKSAAHVVGWEPAELRANRIGEAARIIEENGDRFPLYWVDDFSLAADNSFSALEAAGYSGYHLWGALKEAVLRFRLIARRSGVHVVINCHQAPPNAEKGMRGGPKLSGRLPEDFPALVDSLFRTEFRPEKRFGWKVVYRATVEDPNFNTGCRMGTPDCAPMNLGEIFRAASIKVDRAPGLEWQEGVVELLSRDLLGCPDDEWPQVMGAYRAKMAEAHVAELAIRWAVRDGLDRALLRRAKAQSVFNLFGF